jgi:hypothetical protein
VEESLAEEIGGVYMVYDTCSFFCYTFADRRVFFADRTVLHSSTKRKNCPDLRRTELCIQKFFHKNDKRLNIFLNSNLSKTYLHKAFTVSLIDFLLQIKKNQPFVLGFFYYKSFDSQILIHSHISPKDVEKCIKRF